MLLVNGCGVEACVVRWVATELERNGWAACELARELG